MKKVVLVLAVILAAFTTVNAQKSSKFISGTASYTKSTDVKASYSITPTIGYFVTNKVAVGVFGSFGETATESTTNTFFVKGLAAISFCTFCEKPIITKDRTIKPVLFELGICSFFDSGPPLISISAYSFCSFCSFCSISVISISCSSSCRLATLL
jgi:hypothetical protein